MSKPTERWAKPTMAAKWAMTLRSPKRSPGACSPSASWDGQVTAWKVITSGAGVASAAWAAHRRRFAARPTLTRACQLTPLTRRPIPKSRVSEMTVSVRRARCSLKYCLMRAERSYQHSWGPRPG